MKCPACLNDSKLLHYCSYTPTTLDKLKLFDERRIICCPICNFGMIEKDVDVDVLHNYYSSEYAGKARKQVETLTKHRDLRTSAWTDLRSISQLALISQFIDIKSELTVLEIGPGIGNFLFTMMQAGFVGKHVAFEPQQQAHVFLKQLGSTVESSSFCMNTAKKWENSIDLVVMSHSLEHFNPGVISEIMETVRLILKKDGIFFCEVPNADLARYPNAGEMVVPHLSFFSKASLEHFTKNAKMAPLFINTCGDPQFGKETDKEIAELERMGCFIFDLDESTDILRNRHYHNFLQKERVRTKNKQRLLDFSISLIGLKNVLSVLNHLRIIRQTSLVLMLSTKYFSYGTDREFLRLIAKK